MACYAVAASAQTPVHPHGQKHVGPVHAAPQVDVTARIALLDERIALLTGDMKMFVGELKVQAMADLIEAIIERQKLSDSEIRRLHEQMRGRLNGPMTPAPPSVDPPIELEPDTLCSPFI
jgi:hypothetical protein